MRRSRAVPLLLIAVSLALSVTAPAWGHGKPAEPPKRVVIVVIDQFLPEYVERFNMRNVRALLNGGVNFNRALLGLDGEGRGNLNWYYGEDADESYLDPAPALAPLVETRNLDFSYQDGHVAAWAKDRSPQALRQTAAAMRRLPDVIASYVREGDRYRRVGPLGSMSVREFLWWLRHAPAAHRHDGRAVRPRRGRAAARRHLLRRAGRPRGTPEADPAHTHGVSWPGLKPQKRGARFRAVDVLPTVLELMDVDPGAGAALDGRAYRLKRH